MLNSKITSASLGTRALIPRTPENATINAGDASIQPSHSVKILRVYFDRYMSFDVHVTEMSKNVSGTLMYINRILDLLSREARLIVLQTLALSHLNYGITVWGTSNVTQRRRA